MAAHADGVVVGSALVAVARRRPPTPMTRRSAPRPSCAPLRAGADDLVAGRRPGLDFPPPASRAATSGPEQDRCEPNELADQTDAVPHPHREAARKRSRARGPVGEVRPLRRGAVRPRAGGRTCASAPSATTTCASAPASAWRPSWTTDSGEEIGATLGPVDALQVQGPEEVRRAHQGGAEGHRRARRAGRGAGPAQGPPDLRGARSSSRYMGGSMGSVVGETLHPGRRARAGDRLPAGVLLRHRRRAHAGRPVLADADGQDLGRAGPPARRGPALHLGADASDHRRRVGVAGRCWATSTWPSRRR